MRNSIKASFTIEAVFIMPVVLFIIVFIIYLSFFLHDYCRIKGTVDMVLYKAAINLKHESDIETGKINYDEINKGLINQILEKPNTKEREIEDYISRQLSKGLIASRITDVHASKGISRLTLKVEAEFMFPLKGWQWLTAIDNNLVVKAGSVYHHPANTIRISEVILDTGSKIKGYDKIKEIIGWLVPR
ncbi:MAG TPA: pilus assembly protein [Clostridiales bacterium]|nr:pilus assembly protein [Clostridiales bacterium]